MTQNMRASTSLTTTDPLMNMSSIDYGQIALKACYRIPPMWGLDSFVAVNPYWGFKKNHFIDAAKKIWAYSHSNLFVGQEYFGKLYREGELSDQDLLTGIRSSSLSQYFQNQNERQILKNLQSWLLGEKPPEATDSRMLSLAEAVDLICGSKLNDLIVEEISKFCALYFDKGQAVWQSPFREGSLFEAWKEFASIDKTLELRGIKGATCYFRNLSKSYSDVIANYAKVVDLAVDKLEHLFTREIFSIKGWAAYAQHLAFESNKVNQQSSLVTELLAMRLAYTMLIFPKDDDLAYLELVRSRINLLDSKIENEKEDESLLLNYICQLSLESRFTSDLMAKIKNRGVADSSGRPKLQAVFCIDVRSEGMRRSLEAQSSEIQTYGFAGFFGLFFKYRAKHASKTIDQYPVLLGPKFYVEEKSAGSSDSVFELNRHVMAFVKMVRQSICSGFSYVEAFGLSYVVNMLKSAFLIGSSREHLQVQRRPCELDIEMSLDDKVSAALAMINNIGLQQPMAPVVMLCGHHAATSNNPFASGLDCGACGGHSGDVNARVAAAILNDPAVRARLAKAQIEIPEDTQFVAAVHNTTADTIELNINDDSAEISQIQSWLSNAGNNARSLRLKDLGLDNLSRTGFGVSSVFQKVNNRSLDWSEVRPEWGLAKNAAFIAASREFTKGVALNNRSFLHDYDSTQDSDSSVLELILTAPVVVASWINLQYYGSSVAPAVFGSGNKVLHNVIGQLGVVLGNGGDLQLGLPLQSVHTGKGLFHEPLRLHVIIDAPFEKIEAIVNRHELLQDLIFNGWIKLFSVDSHTNNFSQLISCGKWTAISNESQTIQ
jgi:uncharacterized protein YbcC (UPF0753/DUF2309 family)